MCSPSLESNKMRELVCLCACRREEKRKAKKTNSLLQEIDMINLFGSPAGRAINKITSIKLNKSVDDAKDRMKRITGGVDTITTDLLMPNSISGCGSSAVGYGPTSSSSSSHTANPTIDSRNKATSKYSNLHTKKVKCWKFIEEDKFNNNCNIPASTEKRRLSTELIT